MLLIFFLPSLALEEKKERKPFEVVSDSYLFKQLRGLATYGTSFLLIPYASYACLV